MSKNIRSYFNVISKTKGADGPPSASNSKNKLSSTDEEKEKSLSPTKSHKPIKRKKQILSDSEDEVQVVRQASKKGSSPNGDRNASTSRTSKKVPEMRKGSNKRQVISDSDDEVVVIKDRPQKTQPVIKDKVEPRKKAASAIDVFASKPVKRTEAPKPSKKLPDEDEEFVCDDLFEAALNQIEKSESVNRLGKTGTKTNRDNNERKHSDESDDKKKKVNGTGHSSKVEEAETVSKHFQNTAGAGKDEASKASGSSQAPGSSRKSSDETYEQGVSKISIDKTAAKKRKRSNEDEENDVFEEIIQKKKRGAALYQQYLQRGGARNPGSKEIPTGADNCLAGLSFLITGVLDSMERGEADDLIKKYGGRILHQVSKKTDYVIVGDEPGPSKLEKAQQFRVKTISEDDLLELIRSRPAGQAPKESKNLGGRPKLPLLKAKQKTPEPEPLTASNPGPSPKKEEVPTVNSAILKNEQKTSLPDKVDALKATEVLKKGDIPTVVRVPTGTGDQVWVEKYKPKTMKQIIGQQGDNSNVKKLYHWLQHWQTSRSEDGKRPRPSPYAQGDGAFYKAALLSGPPGVGKTTTVQVVCDTLRLDALEFNASDTRSKRLLKEEVSEVLNNKSMTGYFAGSSAEPNLNHVLVMDEVDGMAGTEDRGGLQELITLIKTTNVPVICICNDRNNPKMRTLANYTFDLKFQKPRIPQIWSAMMSVCFKENIKIAPEDLNRLIESTNNDVRQVLNHLSMLAENPSLQENPSGRKCNKDFKLGTFQVIGKVFDHETHKTMSIHDKSDLFFHDYNISPLFVQENYLRVTPNCPRNKVLEAVADSAESLALGDLVENQIRRSGAWTLLPTQACYSSVIPGTLMSGRLSAQAMFPSWLGQNSKRGKFDRLLQEITVHTRLATSASKDSMNLDYLKHLRDAVLRPLVTQGSEGASMAVEVMNHYHLVREDLDSLAEVALWPGHRDLLRTLDSKVKAAFTRVFNKSSAMTPYALTTGAEKKKRGGPPTQEYGSEDDEYESEEEEDNVSSDPMIKVKKAATANTKNTASKSQKGSAGSVKKSRKRKSKVDK